MINQVKSLISRYGIPDIFFSDNGPQFDSEEFKAFSKEYGFVHTTSSPHYPQSNGEVERCVETVKQILRKAKYPYLAILEYRNTPLEGIGKSPAQLLMGRRLKTTLPTAAPLLRTAESAEIKGRLKVRQQKQAHYYNQRAGKELPELCDGDSVRLQRNGKWISAQVLSHHKTPRSYVVRSEDGGVYRRNRRHLQQAETTQGPESEYSSQSSENEAKQPVSPGKTSAEQVMQPEKNGLPESIASPPEAVADHTSKTTRSGRVIRTPHRFKDYT